MRSIDSVEASRNVGFERMKKASLVVVVLAALGVLAFAIWKTQFEHAERLVAFQRAPEGIMGTSCQLSVVMDYRMGKEAESMLDSAEARIRYIESLASNWIGESEVSRFNAMESGSFEFGFNNVAILKAAESAYEASGGVFDITCRPLISLWKNAGSSGVLPGKSEIQKARAQSSWKDLSWTGDGALSKSQSSTQVDLGGIAKGYAIDLAVETMQALGAKGGMVDIGGDIRFFGTHPNGSASWSVSIVNPEGEKPLSHLHLPGDFAVCTSGNYARYVTIDGVRYSHILNPQTGMPTTEVPSVTVVAATAMEADIWATALSVLGRNGFEKLPDGVEALIDVKQDGQSPEIEMTTGFARFIQLP
jgi:thiamine biosynthesis lipoprotein